MDLKKLILQKLLEKYEKRDPQMEGIKGKRVFLNLLKGDFPDYDIEDYSKKELIHSVVEDLAALDFVTFDWVRFEKGNMMERVYLNTNKVLEANRYIGRLPKKEVLHRILDLLCEHQNSEIAPHHWYQEFLKDSIGKVRSGSGYSMFIPSDMDLLNHLLKGLKEIAKARFLELPERVFSVQVFGNSKYFKDFLRSRVITILRRYHIKETGTEDKMRDDEVMAEVGIVKNPEIFEFTGNVRCKLYGKDIDCGSFPLGFSMNSATAGEIEFLSFDDVHKVVFIENRTNYYDYISNHQVKKELVFYHGGFFSPLKRRLIQKIYEFGHQENCAFYHWGDIDLGGFRIFQRLKELIIPELQPLWMDKNTLEKNLDKCQRFDEKYKTALKELLSKKEYEIFYPTIEYMLQNNIKLEQEALLKRKK